jgi:hypothetical protein
MFAFQTAFTKPKSGSMTEPLEPGHVAILQQAANMHGAFILGFPLGRELTERADRARLSHDIIAQISSAAHEILNKLAQSKKFVEAETRQFLKAIDEGSIVLGWETARTGHAAYVVTRSTLIALGKYLILANVVFNAVLGRRIVPEIDPAMAQQIVDFMMHNGEFITSFAEPFPELRNWLAFIIDHIDHEKK